MTSSVDVEGISKRTTADSQGLETVPQLEFANKVYEKVEGSFAEILAVFKLMEDRNEVESIGYHIGKLNDHLGFRSVCTLFDGVTPRHYLVGKIQLKK
jgi:hypothetical protein